MALNPAHGIDDNFFNLIPELDLNPQLHKKIGALTTGSILRC